MIFDEIFACILKNGIFDSNLIFEFSIFRHHVLTKGKTSSQSLNFFLPGVKNTLFK